MRYCSLVASILRGPLPVEKARVLQRENLSFYYFCVIKKPTSDQVTIAVVARTYKHGTQRCKLRTILIVGDRLLHEYLQLPRRLA